MRASTDSCRGGSVKWQWCTEPHPTSSTTWIHYALSVRRRPLAGHTSRVLRCLPAESLDTGAGHRAGNACFEQYPPQSEIRHSHHFCTVLFALKRGPHLCRRHAPLLPPLVKSRHGIGRRRVLSLIPQQQRYTRISGIHTCSHPSVPPPVAANCGGRPACRGCTSERRTARRRDPMVPPDPPPPTTSILCPAGAPPPLSCASRARGVVGGVNLYCLLWQRQQ